MTDTFPRQQARTQKFSLGTPRSFQISPDGSRVAFLRSKTGTDPVTCLWVLDLPADADSPAIEAERLVVDPASLGAGADEPEEERARRERSRESASGVVAFATDAAFTMAAFAIAGQVYTTGLTPDWPWPEGRQGHVARHRSPARSDWPAGRLRLRRRGQDHRPADRPGHRADRTAHGRTGREPPPERSPTAWRSTWPPRRWAGTAGTGGRRMARRCWSPGPTTPRSPAGSSPTPPIPTADRSRSAIRRRVRRTPSSRLLVVGLDGGSVPVSWDAEAYPYLATADWDDGRAR